MKGGGLDYEAGDGAEGGGPDLRNLLEAYERSLILSALGTVGGRQRSAAALLGLLPTTLNEKMKRLGIRHQRTPAFAHAGADEVRASLAWKGSVPPGGTLEIRGLNGPVRIEGWERAEIEVLATRTGPPGAVSNIVVKVLEHSRGVTICAVCQGLGAAIPRRLTPRPARIVAGARVHIVAKVPYGVHVVAGTLNDDIDVVGLAGNIEASTANGHVRFLPAPQPSPRLALVPQG